MVDRLPLKVLLVGTMLLLVFTGLVASGAAVATTMRAQLVERVDEQLQEAARGWAHRSPPRDRGGPAGSATGGPAGPQGERASRRRPPSQFFVAEYDDEGHLVVTVNDEDHDPQVPVGLPQGRPVTVPSVDGVGTWRLLALPTEDGVTVLGLPMDRPVDRIVNLLIVVSLAVGAVVLLLVGVVGWYLVGRALRPLREVEAAAGEIAAGTLDRRLPDRPAGTEVGGLTRSFNEMIGRLEQSFAASEAAEAAARRSEARTRRFAADASHELRTPLTSIRGFAELHRMGAVPDARSAMSRIEAEAVRMSHLVEDLLTLARLDEEQPLEVAPFDLAEVVADATETVRATDPWRHLELRVDEAPVLRGDGRRIRQVVVNLLANAYTHTPPEASVRVRVGREPAGRDGTGYAVVTVRDDGGGMSPDDVERLFDRFHRLDVSRSRGGGGGSGLGLAIVQGIVAAHRGTIEVRTAPGEGAAFTVRLPM